MTQPHLSNQSQLCHRETSRKIYALLIPAGVILNLSVSDETANDAAIVQSLAAETQADDIMTHDSTAVIPI